MQRNCRVTGHFTFKHGRCVKHAPQGLIREWAASCPQTHLPLVTGATLVYEPPVAVTCASLVTNVVGNLFNVALLLGYHLSSNAC